MTIETTTSMAVATVVIIAVIDPSVQSISVAAMGAVVTIITVVFAYKTAALNKRIEKQNAIIEDVKKTSDGMKDALVKSTAEANLAKGVAEGKAQAEAAADKKDAAKAEGFAEAAKIKDQNMKLN